MANLFPVNLPPAVGGTAAPPPIPTPRTDALAAKLEGGELPFNLHGVIRDLIALAREGEEAARSLSDSPTWVSVGERMPKDGQRVLVARNNTRPCDYGVDEASYLYGTGFVFHSDVTHWMPLPGPMTESDDLQDAIEAFQRIVEQRHRHPNIVLGSDVDAARKDLYEFVTKAETAEMEELRGRLAEAVKRDTGFRCALVAAFPLLRRIRDREDAVQFFEANAVMGMIEDALK